LARLGEAPAEDLVTPFAGRAAAGSALASAFCLAAFGFDLAALAFGLAAFSALAAFFAALPLPALPLPALAVSDLSAPADEFAPRLAVAEPGVLLAAVRAAPDPAAVARGAPFRAVVAELCAVDALDAVEPLARAADALLAVLTAVVLAAGLAADRRGTALAAVTLVAVVLAPEVLDAVVLAGAAERALAASLSDVTAVSSALVADEIAVSALVSVFADVAA
jgi:hypothetical protein